VNGQLGLNVTHADSQTVLTVTGDINMTTSPRMRAALIEAASQRPERMVVDLEGVTYIDSSGIATLVEALQRARREGRQLVLRGLRESIRAVFQLARLDEVFTIVY
jgi:anti-sigma B factor antagonist